jgi:hypothetical protein
MERHCMRPVGVSSGWPWSDNGPSGSYAFGFPRFLRIESPRISMR